MLIRKLIMHDVTFGLQNLQYHLRRVPIYKFVSTSHYTLLGQLPML